MYKIGFRAETVKEKSARQQVGLSLTQPQPIRVALRGSQHRAQTSFTGNVRKKAGETVWPRLGLCLDAPTTENTHFLRQIYERL